jgi:transcriptional regulator with GAF, ATPase, and Fis domain
MPDANDYAGTLTELAGVALAHSNLEDALDAICRIAARALPAADGASLTTESAGVPSARASDDWAQSLDELQYDEHEGPCLDAMRIGNVFRIDDLPTDPRWPSYAPKAGAAGARSALSIPASMDGRVIAALNVYSRSQQAFDADSVSVAQVIAAHAGLAAQVTTAFHRHRDLAEQLREAMQSRAMIEQAKGMIMLRDRCDAEAAFRTLVRASQHSNTKLRDVAQLVVQWGTTREDGLEDPVNAFG